ncbi:MAG: GNAT family N-acetyltransferase [Desulfobulbaceae bacterium]|nr:GNAT family N-acetyltransferase [Desulfobulbaceae bacterium]
MAITLERASEYDLESILELQKRAFYGQALIYDDHTLPSLTQTIEDLVAEWGRMTFYKVAVDGKLVASVRCWIRDRTLYIEKLIVEPAMQNRGIGKRVMIEIEKRYSKVVDQYELATGHKSARNLHLYISLGYREIARRTLNLSCDLVVLTKPVSE